MVTNAVVFSVMYMLRLKKQPCISMIAKVTRCTLCDICTEVGEKSLALTIQ